MPNFVFTYRSPKGYTPSAEARATWTAWFDSMGEHLVEIGAPVFERTAVGDCSPATTDLGGYSVVQAADFDAARALAEGCPYIDRDGGVEIGLVAEIPAEVPSAT